jgi:malate synthase
VSTAGYFERAGLKVGPELAEFVEGEALPATGVDPDAFWQGLAALIRDFSPRNSELLETRITLQAAIDRWHRERAGQPHDAWYRTMLEASGISCQCALRHRI